MTNGALVLVEPNKEGYPPHEFVGTLSGTRDGLLVVVDQDDNAWCVEPGQVETL